MNAIAAAVCCQNLAIGANQARDLSGNVNNKVHKDARAKESRIIVMVDALHHCRAKKA